MKFHHIGYLTLNLKNSFNEFKYLNYSKKGKFINDSKLKAKIQFIKNNSNLKYILKAKNISFDSKDKEFQNSCMELFERLWPNMRQIIRQLQLRSKTGEWVSIPL